MKKWLIIYDIRNVRRLAKVAKLMQNYGVRVQKSIFEAVADNKTIEKLRVQVRAVILKEDFVVYFAICSKDWQKQVKYGPGKNTILEDKSFYVL